MGQRAETVGSYSKRGHSMGEQDARDLYALEEQVRDQESF